jgi:hypothetical protein
MIEFTLCSSSEISLEKLSGNCLANETESEVLGFFETDFERRKMIV